MMNISLKTTTTIAKILTREGLGCTIPGGGAIVDVAEALFEHAKMNQVAISERRLHKFHKLLLAPTEDAKIEDFLEAEFNEVDYLALLRSYLQDIEDSKVDAYSMLFKSFLLSSCSEQDRQLQIEALRNYSSFDLSLLRRIYILSEFDVMDPQGRESQVKRLIEKCGNRDLVGLGRLENYGMYDGKLEFLTSFGRNFAERVFNQDALTPESLGLPRWSGLAIAVFCGDLNKAEYRDFCANLGKTLWRKNIKSSTMFPRGKGKILSLGYNLGLLIVSSKKIDDRVFETLCDFGVRREIIKIFTTTTIESCEQANRLRGTCISLHDELELCSEVNINLAIDFILSRKNEF